MNPLLLRAFILGSLLYSLLRGEGVINQWSSSQEGNIEKPSAAIDTIVAASLTMQC